MPVDRIRFDQLEGNRVNWYVTPSSGLTEALLDLAPEGATIN